MFREINTADTAEVAEICKAALGYDVDIENVKRQIEKLKRRLEKDISNIENFIDKWFSIYTPNITQWNGEVIKER